MANWKWSRACGGCSRARVLRFVSCARGSSIIDRRGYDCKYDAFIACPLFRIVRRSRKYAQPARCDDSEGRIASRANPNFDLVFLSSVGTHPPSSRFEQRRNANLQVEVFFQQDDRLGKLMSRWNSITVRYLSTEEWPRCTGPWINYS